MFVRKRWLAVIGIIVVFMMILSVMPAMASISNNDYEAHEILVKYMKKNNIYDKYTQKSEEEEIYRFYSIIYIDYFEKETGLKGQDWNNTERWFEKLYEIELTKRYPEYGKIHVTFVKMGTEDNVDIFKIVINTENDCVNYVLGKQKRIEIITTFVK